VLENLRKNHRGESIKYESFFHGDNLAPDSTEHPFSRERGRKKKKGKFPAREARGTYAPAGLTDTAELVELISTNDSKFSLRKNSIYFNDRTTRALGERKTKRKKGKT